MAATNKAKEAAAAKEATTDAIQNVDDGATTESINDEQTVDTDAARGLGIAGDIVQHLERGEADRRFEAPFIVYDGDNKPVEVRHAVDAREMIQSGTYFAAPREQ